MAQTNARTRVHVTRQAIVAQGLETVQAQLARLQALAARAAQQSLPQLSDLSEWLDEVEMRLEARLGARRD
jgi:hypothetical protein